MYSKLRVPKIFYRPSLLIVRHLSSSDFKNLSQKVAISFFASLIETQLDSHVSTYSILLRTALRNSPGHHTLFRVHQQTLLLYLIFCILARFQDGWRMRREKSMCDAAATLRNATTFLKYPAAENKIVSRPLLQYCLQYCR